MSWGLALDILLVAIAAMSQAVTGYLGWRVTVDGGAPSKRKKLYKGSFIICAALGFLATVGVAYRGGSVGKDLDQIKHTQNEQGKELRSIEANTKQPPQVTVNMPITPKQRALVALANTNSTDGVEIKSDNQAPHNLFVRHSCKNIGPAVIAKNVACAGLVWKIPAEDGIPTDQTLRQYWREFSTALAKEPRHNGVDLAPGNGVWGSSDLGMTQIEPEFVKGEKVILVTGAIFYGDDVGSHKKEFCLWAQRPVPAPYPVWHSCNIGHNREVY